MVELLISIALIGVVSSFFIPQMIKYSKRKKLEAAANELVTHLESAQNKALSSVQGSGNPAVSYGVFYFPSSNSTGIFRKVDQGTSEEWESEAVEQLSFIEEIKVTWPAANPEFRIPTGKIIGTGSLITICYDTIGYYDIQVKSTGVITLSDRQYIDSCP